MGGDIYHQKLMNLHSGLFINLLCFVSVSLSPGSQSTLEVLIMSNFQMYGV